MESIAFIPDKLNQEQRTTILEAVQRQVRQAVIGVAQPSRSRSNRRS